MIATWTHHRVKTLFFVTTFALYLGVGYWLQVRHGFIIGDALSRVAAAQSVLFSRDPHLAAIGFIFTPLTAVVQIPAIALNPWWPVITERAFAGSIMSAFFMAAAVVQILGMGTDRGLPRAYSMTITALFALNPMIIFYGSNGMSEAPFIFFMSWTVHRLMMWMINDDVHHLVVAGGIAMGLAYLTRYDAVACVAAAGLLVGGTTYVRARENPRSRRALLDLLMVSLPGFAAFLGWAAVSWLITGEAFAQFTSQYGNTSILAQSGQTKPEFFDGLSFAAVSITLLAPTLLPLAGWAVAHRWGRPYWPTVLVPLVIYGAALAFQSYSYASGSTFGFLRFYIIAIPMAASLALLAVPDGVIMPTKRPGRHAPPALVDPAASFRGQRSRPAYVVVALVFAISLPVTAWGMGKPTYAPQEFALGAVLAPQPDSLTEQKAHEHRIANTFSTERRIAHYLDQLGLPDNSVLTDTVFGFAVVTATTRPRMFVIPSDPDFTSKLNDPVSGDIRYMLAAPPTGRGASDALNLRYPTLYETGADIATLELEIPNDGDGQPDWRLYRVNEAVPVS